MAGKCFKGGLYPIISVVSLSKFLFPPRMAINERTQESRVYPIRACVVASTAININVIFRTIILAPRAINTRRMTIKFQPRESRRIAAKISAAINREFQRAASVNSQRDGSQRLCATTGRIRNPCFDINDQNKSYRVHFFVCQTISPPRKFRTIDNK